MADKTQVTLDGETEDLDLVRRHCASRHPDIVARDSERTTGALAGPAWTCRPSLS
jgi:hypothetical protein